MSFLRDMVTRVFGEPVENLQPNVIVDPDDSTRIMHVNADGSINAGIVSGGTSTAIQDGGVPSTIPGRAMYLLSAGGPVDSTGKPQSAAFDRLKSLQGSNVGGSSANITATLVGDTNLVFSVAPKTIMPGAKIQLAVGSGASVETVIVSSTYTPSSTATTIPLQYPVVNASSTTAKWDLYDPLGPGTSVILPTDIFLTTFALQDSGNPGNYSLLTSATGDGISNRLLPETGVGIYNGASFDRMRANLDNVSLITATGVTSTQTGADQTNYNARGVIVTLDMTTVGTGSVTLEIDMKDPVSGKYVALLTGAAVVTNVTNIYTVYPGAPATANVSANSPLPRTWRVKVTVNNANATTYKVGASLIL